MPKPKSMERWVSSVVDRLAVELNLQEWRIKLSFDQMDENPDCVAFTNIDDRYLTAYIAFTPKATLLWQEKDFEVLNECVVHEVTHICLEPLHKFAKQAATPQTEPHLTDILEQANQRLTRIVIGLLPSKFFDI